MKTSNCCGANVYDDSDICSRCKEHCGDGVLCYCELNDGEGEYHEPSACECSEKCKYCYPKAEV